MTDQQNYDELKFLKKYFEDRLSFSKIGIKPVVYTKAENDYEVYFEFFLTLPDGNVYSGMSNITIPEYKLNENITGSTNDLNEICWFD